MPPGRGRAGEHRLEPLRNQALVGPLDHGRADVERRAMRSSDPPTSAWRHTCARVRRRAATLPRVVKDRSGVRSSSDRATTYYLAMAPAWFCRRRQEKSYHIKIAVVTY